MYKQAVDLATSQIEALTENSDDAEDLIESLSSQIRLFSDLLTQAESEYFNACADLWIAESLTADPK